MYKFNVIPVQSISMTPFTESNTMQCMEIYRYTDIDIVPTHIIIHISYSIYSKIIKTCTEEIHIQFKIQVNSVMNK